MRIEFAHAFIGDVNPAVHPINPEVIIYHSLAPPGMSFKPDVGQHQGGSPVPRKVILNWNE
jgi:hypothetical protein